MYTEVFLKMQREEQNSIFSHSSKAVMVREQITMKMNKKKTTKALNWKL